MRYDCTNQNCPNAWHQTPRCPNQAVGSTVSQKPGITVPSVSPVPQTRSVPVHKAVPGPMTEHVPASDVPLEFLDKDTWERDPYGPAYDDHPSMNPEFRDRTFTLRMVRIDDLAGDTSECVDGAHSAECYSGDRYLLMNAGVISGHDIMEPVWSDDPDDGPHKEWSSDDADAVRKMAESADTLPPLVLDSDLSGSGGNHRMAAWHEAGMEQIPCWVADPR